MEKKRYTCKCGAYNAWATDDKPPRDCEYCLNCGTTLALTKAGCKKPMPHDFKRHGNNAGAYLQCTQCHQRDYSLLGNTKN